MKTTNNKPKLEISSLKVTVDDVLLTHTSAMGILVNDERSYISIATANEEESKELAAFTFLDFKKFEVEDISLNLLIDWQPALGKLRFIPDENDSLSLTMHFDGVHLWARPYTFSEYYNVLGDCLSETDFAATTGVVTEDEDSLDIHPPGTFAITFKPITPDIPLGQEVDRCLNLLRILHDNAIAKLEAEYNNSGSVELLFDFPEEVRIPCEQYLLYFVQFLKDLGVEATADLRHEAGKVMFAVTPGNKDTALDNIRIALQTYLQLPSSPLDTDSVVEYEIAAQRLAANVDHLKGQVRLVNAELRLANAIIRQQQITIDTLLSNVEVLKSLNGVNPTSSSDEPEPLLNGTISLTTLDEYGVRVSLDEVFRKLRRLFSES